MMFKPKNNAGHSMLATKLEYWPYNKLTEAARKHIVYHRETVTNKEDILDRLNEDMTHISVTLVSRSIPGRVLRKTLEFKVVWAYGNPPTKTEWDRIGMHDHIITELRTVPMLGNYNGKSANICILSLPASTLL